MTDDFIHFAHRVIGTRPSPPMSDESEIAAALEAPEPAWIHMRADDPRSDEWIDRHLAYLAEPVQDALTAKETRPRLAVHGDGVLLILRGVNLNPGADPEDMVALRLWADPSRIVSLSRRRLMSLEDLASEIREGHGPDDTGALISSLIDRLSARIAKVVQDMDLQGDEMEEQALRGEGEALRGDVADLRAAAVDFRRFLIPQRDAVAALAETDLPMFEDHDHLRFAEAEDTLRRLVEEIESLRERLVVVKDELASQHSDRLNRNLYILSIVSAVFLPLGFLTGLMGINLAGMPGAAWPPAFWVFTAGLGVILVLQVIVLWRLRFVSRSSARRRAKPP